MEKKEVSKNTLVGIQNMRSEYSMSGCTFIDSKLNFCKWNITVTMSSSTIKKGESKEDYQKRLALCYNRITSWIQYFLSDIFIIDVKEREVIEGVFSINMDNPVMMSPGTPSDALLVQLIYSKINAISCGDLLIDDVDLSEIDSKISFFFDPTSQKLILPAQKDFMGPSALHSKPWWDRFDCDTFDLEVPKGVKRKDMLSETDTSYFLKDLEASAPGKVFGNSQDGEILEFPSKGHKWKPEET